MKSIELSRIAFGAFKIGRNQNIKYASGYDLPTEEETATLLNGVLDLGITLLDTAPAYGLSEERIGRHLSHRNNEFLVSTKVGEAFHRGNSTYAFDHKTINASIDQSLSLLKRSILDVVLVHSDGRDHDIITESDALDTLSQRRDQGDIARVGFSPKSAAGAIAAIETGAIEVLMLEFNPQEQSSQAALHLAAERNVDVFIKKGLGSGSVPAEEAIPFCLEQPAVKTVVIGSLSLEHMAANITTAASCSHGES